VYREKRASCISLGLVASRSGGGSLEILKQQAQRACCPSHVSGCAVREPYLAARGRVVRQSGFVIGLTGG
jgi:hypothetical protein